MLAKKPNPFTNSYYAFFWFILFVINALAAAHATPAITSPAEDSQFSGNSLTFEWSANGASISAYALTVGSSEGNDDIHDSGELGADTLSETVTGIGGESTLHIRLWYRSEAGLWSFRQTTLDAGTGATPPAIFSPEDGSIFESDTVDLSWRDNGTVVTRYWLFVGSSSGASNYLSQSVNLATTHTLTGLPTDGSDIYIRLWYFSGFWQFTDHRYNATGGGSGTATVNSPELLEPEPGSILLRNEVTFRWTDNDTAPENYWLYIGSTQGSFDILSSGALGTVNEFTFSNVPLDTDALYVRLWYFTSENNWLFTDYTYTSSLYGGSQIIAPEPGSIIDSVDQRFEWVENGEAVQDYQLLLGSSQASNDIYDSGLLTSNTREHTALDIDIDQQQIHVTLRHRVNGVWQENHYLYTTPSSAGFDENFNGDISRWTERQGVWFNGELQYLSTETGDNWSQAYYNSGQFSDFEYSARVRRSDNEEHPTFLTIRDGGNGSSDACWCVTNECYSFEISPTQDYAVWSCRNSNWEQIQPLSRSNFINPGNQWNELRVLAEGEDLSFYINDNLAWQGKDSDHSSGHVGLGLVNFDDNSPNALDVDWARLSVIGTSTELATNLAVSGVATQQSTDFGGLPARAIDGNTSGVWRDGSVTHTERVAQPWWQVELAQQSQLELIRLYNRTDCCSQRLSDVHVFISDNDMSARTLTQLQADSTVTSHFFAGVLDDITEQVLSNTRGRYVRIQLDGTEFLSLAEVEVIGR